MATRLDAHRPARTPAPGLRRDLEHRLIGGVCAGIARAFGIDTLLVRIAFIAAAAAGGVGVAVYLVLWVAVPAGEGTVRAPRLRTGRAAVEVGLGVGLLLLSVLLVIRNLGLPFSDAIVWPLVLVASGGALLWRQSQASTTATAAAIDTPSTVAGRAARARGPAPRGRASADHVAHRSRRRARRRRRARLPAGHRRAQRRPRRRCSRRSPSRSCSA